MTNDNVVPFPKRNSDGAIDTTQVCRAAAVVLAMHDGSYEQALAAAKALASTSTNKSFALAVLSKLMVKRDNANSAK